MLQVEPGVFLKSCFFFLAAAPIYSQACPSTVLSSLSIKWLKGCLLLCQRDRDDYCTMEKQTFLRAISSITKIKFEIVQTVLWNSCAS